MSGALFSSGQGGDTVVYGRKNENIIASATNVSKYNTHGGAPSVPLTAGGIYRVECEDTARTAVIKIGEGVDPSSPPDPASTTEYTWWDFSFGAFYFVALPGQLSIQVDLDGVGLGNTALVKLS